MAYCHHRITSKYDRYSDNVLCFLGWALLGYHIINASASCKQEAVLLCVHVAYILHIKE
jgi:hypothetical protein